MELAIKISKISAAVLFFAVLVIIHINWIFSLSPLISGDWPYFGIEQLKEWAPLHSSWINYESFGRPIVQGNFIILFSTYSWFASLGLDFSVISRILFFIPVLICSALSIYLFVTRITSDKFAGVIASAIYTLNSYFIVIQAGHMHLCIAYAVAPFAYFFAIKSDRKNFMGLLVSLAIISVYEVRMSLVIAVTALGLRWFYTVKSKRSFLKYILRDFSIIGFVLIGIHIFWLLPTFHSINSPFDVNYYEQDALNWVATNDAFSLHHPFWSQNGVTDFTFNSPAPYMFILPALAFMPFFFKRKRENKEAVLYLVICLIGLFFLLQGNKPLGDFYNFIYDKIPIMNFYREATKFFIIVNFCYGVLIALLIKNLSNDKINRLWAPVVGLTVIAVMATTCLPYIKGNYVKSYAQAPASDELKEINKKINSEKNDYKNLWVSRAPALAESTSQRPSINSLWTASVWNSYQKESGQFTYLNQQNTPALLNFSGFKNIIVPNEKIDHVYRHYSDLPTQYYTNMIEKNNIGQKTKIGKSTLWENNNYKPHLYFSTNNVFVENDLSDYIGIDDSKTSTYFFRENNTNEALGIIKHNIQNRDINPFTADRLMVTKGNVKSNLSPRPQENLTVFQAKSLYSNKNSSDPASYNAQKLLNQDQLTLPSLSVSGENLFSFNSFEGSRPAKIGDCNNTNNTDPSVSGIKGGVYDKDASDGKRSLKMEVRDHIACFGSKVKEFNPNANYYISFDYKNLSPGSVEYSLFPYNNKPEKRVTKLEHTSTWKTRSAMIKHGELSDSMSLVFYLNGDSKTSKSALIDNVKVYKLPDLLPTTLKTTNDSLPDLKINTINKSPAKHIFTVDNLSQARTLVFSETYNKNWSLYMQPIGSEQTATSNLPFGNPGNKVDDKNHVMANGYANSWIIDPKDIPDSLRNKDGKYQFTLIYEPDRWLNLGIIISLTFVLGIVGYIIYINVRKEKKHE